MVEEHTSISPEESSEKTPDQETPKEQRDYESEFEAEWNEVPEDTEIIELEW